MAEDKDYSVEALIKWLETKPADEPYDWIDADHCLLGQWCASKGLEGQVLHDKSCNLGENDTFYEIALKHVTRNTFGAALKRARRLAVTSKER